MSRFLQFTLCLLTATAVSVHAQPASPAIPPISPAGMTHLMPPVPQLQSPVTFFRQLLAMSPIERNHSLTNRPPETRARILAKIREYQLLAPDERELRLRATELRWWLTPLLHQSPTNRAARLAQVPEDLRGLVQSRLSQWDIIPPPLRQELLTNASSLHYFARVESTNQPPQTERQQKISEQFNQFFELTRKEKQQSLGTLSTAERAQIEKTLKTFEQLPPQQRLQCVRNYAKFTGLSASERAQFLKNAEQWSKMSPQERQSWRDLVAQVQLLPPLPPPTVPANIMPPAPLKKTRPSMATN